MELSEHLKDLAKMVGRVKKVVDGVKGQVGEVKSIYEVKALLGQHDEVGRKLDMMKENMEEKTMALVELEEVIETLLREVHEPPSLVDLAAGRRGWGWGRSPPPSG